MGASETYVSQYKRIKTGLTLDTKFTIIQQVQAYKSNNEKLQKL